MWLALDPEGRRHLIVRAEGGEPGRNLLSVRGLRADVSTLAFESEPEAVWADIVCLEPEFNDRFVAVADDLVKEIHDAPDDLLDAVRRTLRTWQWFWGVETNGLSTESEVGLLGEVWFIDRWAPFPHAIDTWLGPTGHRHDFSTTSTSVEVKATRVRSDGAARHQIANLDQLADPETGRLLLFSLQVVSDPNAANTLAAVVDRVRRRLRDRVEMLGILDRRLAQAGWSPPPFEEPSKRWRIVAEEMYRVDEGFPRLTRDTFGDGLPAGINDIRYSLDLAACAYWRVASQPAEATDLLAGLHP